MNEKSIAKKPRWLKSSCLKLIAFQQFKREACQVLFKCVKVACSLQQLSSNVNHMEAAIKSFG